MKGGWEQLGVEEVGVLVFEMHKSCREKAESHVTFFCVAPKWQLTPRFLQQEQADTVIRLC